MSFTAEELSKSRRQKQQQAQQLAASGAWKEAVALNQEILEGQPNDAQALNRLGKALSELRRYDESYAAYSKSVEIDPANVIAKRNLQRLEPLKNQRVEAPAERRHTQARQSMFIEEIGKSRLTELVAVASSETLAQMNSGDSVELRPEGRQVVIYSEDGLKLGRLESRLALRLNSLIEGGNRYSAAVTAVEPGLLRVIIRETYQAPSLAGRLSFPVQNRPVAPRPYLRDSARALIGDEDFLNDEDAEDEDTDTEAPEVEEEEDFTDADDTTTEEPEEEHTI